MRIFASFIAARTLSVLPTCAYIDAIQTPSGLDVSDSYSRDHKAVRRRASLLESAIRNEFMS